MDTVDPELTLDKLLCWSLLQLAQIIVDGISAR